MSATSTAEPIAVRESVGLEYMPGLDGLRGVAVVAVVVYHLEPTWLPGGFIGVDVFFVLSGFLITSLLLRERIVAGRIDLRRFLVRRFRRLMPAILLLLTVLSVYASTWAKPIEESRLRRHGLAAVSYTSNWVFIADGTTYTDVLVGSSPLRHVWSLAIEEQLYVVLAALVLALSSIGHARGIRTRFGIAVGVLAIASATWMAWLSIGGASTERTYFGTDTRAHGMLIGAIVGAALLGRPAATHAMTRWAGLVGVGFLIAVAFVGAEDAPWLHRGGFLVVAVAAAALVVAAASDPTMRRILSARPLRAIGSISYGLYLWHWAVLVIVDEDRTGLDGAALTLVRLVISVVAAVTSHVVVERPIRHGALGRRWGRGAVPAALSMVAIVVVVFVQATVVTSSVDAPARADEAGPQAAPAPLTSEAISSDDAGVVAAGGDPTGASGDGAREPIRLAVLGDSVAHTIIGGMVSLTAMEFAPWTPQQTSFDPDEVEVISITAPGCSFLPYELAILGANGSYDHASMDRFCGDWRTQLQSALGSVDVLMVHLTNDLEDRWNEGDIIAFGSPEYFDLLDSFLDELHAATSAAGVPMLLVAAAPRTEATWRDEVGARERVMSRFYVRWASTKDDVTTSDLGSVVCPDEACTNEVGGVTMRLDGRHYTPEGARLVADRLTPVILAAV